MPIYESNGKKYNIPDDKIDSFLQSRKDAKLVDSTPYYLSRANSTPRESNISKQNDTPVEENSSQQPNNGISGGFTTFQDGTTGYIPGMKMPEIKLEQPKLGIPKSEITKGTPFESKSFQEATSDVMKNMPVRPEAAFEMSVDRYKQVKEWIEQVQKDSTISPEVKQALMDEYLANIRTNDTMVDDKNLPPAAKEWLERNKVSREVTHYNPSIMGGGSYTRTIKENTPEQIAFIKDYVANSAEGQRYAQTHKEWIEGLESEITPLLSEIESIRETSKKNKEAYAKRHNISTWTLKSTNYRNDAILDRAANLLKNTKLRLSANREGGGFKKGLHLTDEDLKELAVLTESFYNDKVLNQVIDKYEKDPSSLSKEENIIIQAKYIADQINAGVDPGSWYNIGQTTKESLPFMRDFILTAPIGGGVVSGVKSGLSALAGKTGANFLLSRGIGSTVSNLAKGAIDLSVRPAVQTMFSPSSYAMAYNEMQGQAIDRDEQGNIKFDNRKSFEHGATSAFIENQSEVLGEVVLDKLFQRLRIPLPAFMKTNAAKRLSNLTGIQNPITEYAEEKYSDLANIVRGEQTIEGFFDPRQNLETFGAVAIMQIPFSAINGTGYGIGKTRDAQAKHAIRQAYDKSSNSLTEYFGEDAEQAVSAFNNLVDNSNEEELKQELLSVIEDERLDDNAKRAIVEYVTSYSAYSGLNRAKVEQVQEAQEETAQLVQENSNPQMDAVVSAVIGGYDNPMQVVGGNIIQNEDGSINRDLSDQSVTIIDAEGKRVPVSIKFVESISENIPTQDAINQASQLVAEPIIAQQENEEIRPYEVGEVITADAYGNGVPFTGEITGVTEDGKYIVTGIQSGQQMTVEPRQIINQDNIQGVEDGSLIEYRNNKGEVTQGIVGSMYALRPQGMIALENGEAVAIENVIGLAHQQTEQTSAIAEELPPPPADMMIGENGAVPYNPSAPAQETNIPYIEQIPQDEKGNLLFDQVPVETTIGALSEVYKDVSELSGVVDATINNINKQIDKAKSPKPTGDINKDIANKQKANQQIEELNNRLSYWEGVRNTIQQSRPIEQRVTEQLTGEETPTIQLNNERKPRKVNPNTPFQRRLNAVEENIHSVRDRILFGIASGAYKFRWNDKGVSMGLAKELGLSGSEAERKARIGILSNNGYTPTSLAHHIWEETGMELNDNDIRSEVIDVLNSVSSRKQALETLENNAGITEEQYQQQQTEASDYELELRAQEEALISEALEQINEEDLLSLRDRVVELGATEQQLDEVFTSSDFIDLIEQLENGQESDSQPGNEQSEIDSSEGSTPESTERRIEEGNRSAETEGTARQDSDSTGNGINLSPEEQRVVNEATAEIDAEIAEVEKELSSKKKELTAAKKRLAKAQAETQGNLFGDTQQPTTLFDVAADLSKKNVLDAILKPIKDRITFLNSSIANLQGQRERRINEALDNYHRQGNVFEQNNNPRDIFQSKLREEFPNGIKLYHRTTPENWESIKKDGQINMSEHSDGADIGIHTVIEEPDQQRVGYDNSVLLEINVPVENYNKLYPEEATYWHDFSDIDGVEFDNNDMLFDTYMNSHPEIKGGDIVYIDTIPLNMVSVYGETETVNDKIARAESETDTNPTEAQKEAGNYKKGKVTIQGFDISIEQPQGSVRSGVDENGKQWSVTMNNTYGYIRKTEGKDGDHIDVFLGDNPESNKVFVIDQVNPNTGQFDEHKIMLGFNSALSARKAYLSNYEKGWKGLGNITTVDIETFRKWTDADSRRVKPFAEYKEIQEATSITESESTVQEVVPMDGWENNLMKSRKYAKDLIEANLLQPSEALDAVWTDAEKLTSFIKQSLENNNIQEESSSPAYGASNKLISSEQYEELRKRMRNKLNNLNTGFDPELFTIGTQMAMYHIEAGARKFANFASRMVEDLGVNVRPYLKSFYESARHAPGMENLSKEMDSFNEVNSYDLENLTTFEESNTSNNNSNETNRDNRSDNSLIDDGRVSTGTPVTDVREQSGATETENREQGAESPAMERSNPEQRGRSERNTGNNADTTGTGLRTTGTETNSDNGRKDTGNTNETGKPLNTNNNRQARGENVVPRGNTAKINANIAAIKLAKRLFDTGKKATPEQMNALRKYTGWGGLSSVFQQNDKNYKTLQDVLTHEEYESARASTTTAFYTPQEITSSVWDMVEKLGFKGGTILEPSAGIGNFFALMPENISNVSQLRGVELDNISGTILKLLYPDAKIDIAGFEKQRIANNSVDLVVSNVPFGNFKVHDTFDKDLSSQFDIHDYFIAKSIRKLKAGGIGVFITTSSTLDKSASLRNWIINNGNADFIDAIRLNTDTFKNDAGTEATADIIIVRKRDTNGRSVFEKNMQDSVVSREATYMQQEKDKWGYNTGEVEKKARMTYNKYFIDNPGRLSGEMMFGFEGGNAIRPTEQRLAPVKSINQQEVIDKMIADLPSNIYNTTPAEQTSKAVANNGTKEGGLTIIDGQPYIVRFDTAMPTDWNSNKVAGYPKTEALQDYLDIKNAIDNILEAENSIDNEPTHLNKLRNNLNKTYDNFVNKYGTLNENRKINFLQDDVDFTSVSAIENIEDNQRTGEKTISKSDIFSKRVIDKQIDPKAENITDAVRISINQNGKVDIPYIAQLLDKTNEEVQSEIVNNRIGFVNPETGLVESRNQYLSGNVRDKLSIAQQANQDNEFDTNIEELSKVIPTDIPINLIKMTLGSTWIPERVYNDFFKETFDVNANIRKTSTDKFVSNLSGKGNAKDIQMGMPEAGGSVLALNSMNNTTTTISMQVWEDGRRKTKTDPLKTAQAAAKQTELAETFEAWIKQKKEYTEELENIYNNTFNAIVNTKIDVDSFDRFPGVGGKLVRVQSNFTTKDNVEVKQFRVAKENTEADNNSVLDLAKKLDISYDKKTGLFSTDSSLKAAQFEKEANGTAKILRQHQKEGVIRGLEGATLLAHEVGTGKTLTLITTAMEMRRLGLAKKPTIVVQRSTYKQFVKEIKNQYPNAKVLVPSAKDLTAKQRQQLFAKIAYNDWDIVVLYHSYLDSIPDDPGRVAQYIDERIAEKMDLLDEMERAKEDGATNAGRMIGSLKKEIQKLERERDNTLNPELEEEDETEGKSKRKRSVKDIEKVRANTEARLERSLDRRTDNTMTFEQLGIDALLVDEAHAYKKLGFVTSLQRVKGIDTAESKRAQSTRLKSSYILENHNGKNVVFATGTPISNTMAEMWTFLRYLLPRTEMSRLQMNNFDAFVNNFGSIEESAEFGSNGKFRVTNRFSSYSNVPELIAAWRQVAHTVLTEEVATLKEGVGTPRVEGGKPSDVMLEQTAPLKSVMKAIKNKLEWFDRLSGKEKKEVSYIPLVMFGLAKRAAIDVRLVDPNLPDDVNSKTNIAVRDILQDLRDTASYKGTIAVFCDSYQSSDKTFNVFKDIKQKLIDKGIPAEQIAIINDYEKDEAKEKLFAAVNNGDIRVVMGTTEKLGVGVNIQERLHMAGHLDAPLRPSDYQQRNGRIIRQGNTHLNMDKTVKIMRWGVKKTLDVTGYQRLEIKKKFIDQIMKGDVSQRMLEEADIESTDSANFNQMMANLSGSQAALALSIEQNKLKKLYNARQYHNDNQIFMTGAVKRARGVIVGNGQTIEKLEKYKKAVLSSIPGGKITEVSIGKVTANTPDDIDALLNKHITKKVDAEAEVLRNEFLRETSQMKTSISVNGIKLDLTIDIKRHYDVDTKKTRVTREIRYTSPSNTVENPFFRGEDYATEQYSKKTIPLFNDTAGANIQNVISQINYELSGQDINSEIQKYRIGIDKAQRDIDAYESQIGQDFAKEKELQSTEQRVADLEEQMKEELKVIEAEEANENVEAIDIDDIVEKNTEDNPEDDPTPTGGRRQTTSSGTFENIPAEKFDRLVDKLNQTGLATDVIIEENINGTHTIQDKEGNVYGYVTPEGVVHLDAQNMNANTPIHEFGHLWSSFIRSNDSTLYNRGIELIMQSPYWERVNNNSDYAQLSEAEKVDEALATAIGDKGEAITNRSLKQRFIDWLSDLWQSVKQAFGINTTISIEDMTLSDFTDRAVQDLFRGERLSDTSVSLDNAQLQSVNDLANANNSAMTEDVRNQLDKELKRFRNRLREQWEDRHLPVKVFLDVLRKNGTEVREHDDYYKRATHINGSIDAQLEHYNEEYQRPLNKAISNLEKAGFDYRAIENYAILKHGIERNEWMRQDAINQYKQNNPEANVDDIEKFSLKLPDDYSGITAVQEEVGMSAEDYISDFENKAGNKLINDLWKKIKASTTYSLQKQKEGGLIDKKTLEELTSRYEYYIPLRGHDAEVAEDRWDYSPNMGTYFVAPLIKAKGRKTRSESPFAYIFSMAQSSINSANRNLLNQTILRLAMMDKTKLLGVNKAWYVQSGLNEDSKPVYEVQSPTYSENAEQYEKNIAEFEERMQKMAEAGLAVQSGSKLDIGGLFIKRNQAEQHEVHIYQNGTEYVVYINANPAVARAITGANAKDLHKDLRFIARISRQMAANFTTRNPIFVLSNFSRDYIFASSILPVKENAKYAIQFQRNMPNAAMALQRYLRGKKDVRTKYDVYLSEYIFNGAKTGFSHIVELQKIQKQIEREIKKGDSKNVFRHLLDALESCNEFAENLSRLSVYVTSREQGRSITQSVSDAKEVTVNFNRNGAGGWGAAWFRSLYLFVNAGIQALSNFAKVAQKNKAKTAVLISSYAMSGFLMPMLTALLGGDDGLDEYMKLSEWERQNNLCLYTGNGFIKIPLPHELRVFHAMGDNIYQASFGKKDVTESIVDVLLGFSDLIPANPMGAVQGSWADVMPDATKPFFQLAANKNFTGSKITNEWADENKPGYLRVRTNKKGDPYAPAFLVKLGESLDNVTGGDGVEKGLISFNPDEVNHLLRGYFGGLYSIGMQVLDLSSKTYDWTETGEFNLKVRETPLKTFYASSDDLQTTSSGLNSKYFKIADDIQETRRKIKGYKEQAAKGQIDVSKFSEKISGMATDIEKYKRVYPYLKQIQKYESALKELNGDQQKEAEKIISNLKKEVIEINNIMGK